MRPSTDKVLAPAVKEVLRQIHDYSSIRLEKGTPVAIVPVEATDESYADVAEYISEQMIFAAFQDSCQIVVFQQEWIAA